MYYFRLIKYFEKNDTTDKVYIVSLKNKIL